MLTLLAPCAAPLFPQHRHTLLVACTAALAQPITVATLGHDPLLAPRRYPEHGPIGCPGLLGASPLSHLSYCATPMGYLGSRRPGSSRGHHVGARFTRLPCASRTTGDAAPERPEQPGNYPAFAHHPHVVA